MTPDDWTLRASANPTEGVTPDAEGLLALSQRKLDALAIPLAYIDRREQYRFANRAFFETTGRGWDDVVGREVAEVLGREIHARYRPHLLAAFRGERTSFERQLVVPDREPFWVLVDYYPDRAPQGTVRGVVVTYSDIDRLKRVELESREREHRLRLVTDNAGAAIFYLDRELVVRFANQPFAESCGQPGDSLCGKPVREILPPAAWGDLETGLAEVFAGRAITYERDEATPGGQPRRMRINIIPDHQDGEVAGAFVVAMDVEDDLQIREALLAQQERLHLFADNIPGPIAYLDQQLTYTFCNQAFATDVGRPQSEIYGRTPAEVLPAEFASFIAPILDQARTGEQVDYERVGTSTGGERRWLRGRVVPDHAADGTLRGLYCTEYDIHDLKQTEAALETREEQLRLFTDNIPEPVVYLDAECRYVFVNEAYLQLASVRREDIIGRRLSDDIGVEDSLMLGPNVEQALVGTPVTYERPVVDSHGHTRWMRARIVPDLKFDGSINGLYVVAHDITDVRDAQDALAARESQLAAIMDGIPAPVAYLDPSEHCRYVNRSFLEFFGLDPAQVSELRLGDVVGYAIYQSAQAMIRRALEGEATAFDRLVTGMHGQQRWMSIRLVPDMSGYREVHGAFVVMHDVHGLKQAQEALRASEAELRLIMDNVPARISYVDCEFRLRFVNRHNEEWLGTGRKALTGRLLADVMGAPREAQLRPLFERVLEGEVVSTELLLEQPSGTPRWEQIHLAPNRDAEGQVVGIYAAHTDVHEEKRNEEALRRANWMLSSHINNTPLAVLEWDRDFRLVRWSPQAEHIFGWSADEVLGMPLTSPQLVHEADREQMVKLANMLAMEREPRATGLMRSNCKDGRTIWCEWYHSCLLDAEGRLASILSFAHDVSARIEAEERLQYMATRDMLTGLPNRVLLHERLAQAIAAARRTGRRVGVLFIDLDRFKNVNDTLGHRIGDLLLKQVTQALSSVLRQSDLLARLGGDEFVIVVEDIEDPGVLGGVARKLLDAVAQPFRIEDHDIYVTSSIGISVYPDDSDDPDELMKHADVAMYRSKELGRNTYQFLDAGLAAHRLRQHDLERALRAALRDDQLVLHYQPIVRIEDGRVVAAEALLRWRNGDEGEVPPQIFIGLAEESGLIHALGEWVLRAAARQCVAWRRSGVELRIAVNLSGRQFYRDDLVSRVKEVVREEGCEPQWIELEVTETSLLHDLDAIRKALSQLREHGFTVAIDDFGTGYSSLTHLKHLPIDSLKIDISFIADLEADPGDAAITEAIIGLARGLGLRVVAEGVGTQTQLDFLRRRGCHCMQGFWISKAMPGSDVVAFVRRQDLPDATGHEVPAATPVAAPDQELESSRAG